MDIIKNLLDKYINLTKSFNKDEKEILYIINKTIDIELNLDQLKIIGNKVNLEVSPIIKSEILFNKDKILSSINSHPNIAIEIIEIN